MPPRDQVDGDGDQAQRPGKRSRAQRVEREYRMSRGFDYGSRGSRIDRVNQHRNHGLQEPERFVSIGWRRRDLGVRIRGKGRKTGENNSSESHCCLHFSTCDRPRMHADSRGWD
jgi:hypothetical protein